MTNAARISPTMTHPIYGNAIIRDGVVVGYVRTAERIDYTMNGSYSTGTRRVKVYEVYGATMKHIVTVSRRADALRLV